MSKELDKCYESCLLIKKLKEDYKEKNEYITDLEEECENLSEQNRLLVEKIKMYD